MSKILDAKNTIGKISHAAKRGDGESIAALRDIALQIIGTLENLTDIPPEHPDIPEPLREGISAAHSLAQESHGWPVRWDAIAENRNKTFSRIEKLKVGENLGIKLTGKHQFGYNQQSGFAYDVFLRIEEIRKNASLYLHIADAYPDLNKKGVLTAEQSKRNGNNLAALLPSLALSSLEQWTNTALEICRDDCENDWLNFPWPDCVYGKAGKDTDGNGTLRTTESAIRGKLFEGLKALI